MLKFGFLPLIIVLAFFLMSCDDSSDPFDDIGLLYAQPRERDSFYAQNVATGNYYEVKAELLANGEKCVVWAENGSGVTRGQAKEIANEYDYNIRSKIVNTFGKKNFYANTNTGYEVSANSPGSRRFGDILDYANWLVNKNDGKLTILLLDIKDSYDKDKNPSYVAGYFSAVNFYSKGQLPPPDSDHYSNGRDMIYIDTNPGLRGDKIQQTYSTLAHELQHLINFVTTVLVNRSNAMDTWVDEGLSAWAEYLYLGENIKSKCEWFINDEKGTISKGNNFFVWGNHEEEPMAILDDYATVYLFFRWLSLQAPDQPPQNNIFYQIITSQKFNHEAVTEAAKNIDSKWGTWGELIGTWHAANHNPKNDNYGYKNDPYLRDNIKVTPITGPSISLYPGEGVYSRINTSFTPSPGGTNIRYAGLSSANTSTVNISSSSQTVTGNTLLTFNSNTNRAGTAEEGRLTGHNSILPRTLTVETNAVEFKGPYVIDAGDVLGRNRDKYPFPMPVLSGR